MPVLVMKLIRVERLWYVNVNITLVETTVIVVVKDSNKRNGSLRENKILFVNVCLFFLNLYFCFISACNCHGHSDECVFDEALEKQNLSLDIHGRYQGGGKCLNCRDNTVGINCNQCADGFYRPVGKYWNETDVCQRCQCDPGKHLNKCAEETGVCECLPQFAGPNCDQCAEGYYHPPECRPCECNVNGTSDGACLPEPEGKCNCKDNFYGDHCELCAPGYTNVTASCVDCHCDASGSQNNECDVVTGECNCASNFAGKTCSSCAKGYYDHPQCKCKYFTIILFCFYWKLL